MNSLFFTIQHRRSLHTLRIHYGIKGMKYIVQIYEGEVNGHGERECLPTEYQYEFEQEMLKHIHKLKQELSEKGWSQQESPEVFHTFFREVKSRMLNWDFNLSESNGVRTTIQAQPTLLISPP